MKSDLKLQNVPGDGNCFYHAMADQIMRLGYIDSQTSQPLTHKKLRSIAIGHIQQNHNVSSYCNQFCWAASDGRYTTFDQYTQAHSRNGEWADEIIKTALASELNINIVIFSPLYSKPLVHKQENALCTTYIYYANNHYQSVLSKDSDIKLSDIDEFRDTLPHNTEYTNSIKSNNWLLHILDDEIIKKNIQYIEQMRFGLKIEHLILIIKYLIYSDENPIKALKNALDGLFKELFIYEDECDKYSFVDNIIKELKQIAAKAEIDNIKQFDKIYDALNLTCPANIDNIGTPEFNDDEDLTQNYNQLYGNQLQCVECF